MRVANPCGRASRTREEAMRRLMRVLRRLTSAQRTRKVCQRVLPMEVSVVDENSRCLRNSMSKEAEFLGDNTAHVYSVKAV